MSATPDAEHETLRARLTELRHLRDGVGNAMRLSYDQHEYRALDRQWFELHTQVKQLEARLLSPSLPMPDTSDTPDTPSGPPTPPSFDDALRQLHEKAENMTTLGGLTIAVGNPDETPQFLKVSPDAHGVTITRIGLRPDGSHIELERATVDVTAETFRVQVFHAASVHRSFEAQSIEFRLASFAQPAPE